MLVKGKRTNHFFALVMVLVLLVSILVAPGAAAQEEDELRLRLSRDFGYASGTGKIQGTFSMRVSGPDDLEKVSFYIDEEEIGQVIEAPFHLRFVTDHYGLGVRSMYAIGYTEDGSELRSNVIKAEFVSAEEGWDAGLKILAPILAITFGVILFSFIGMFLTGRKTKDLPPGTPRKYGVAGGAICPRCRRPYSRHVFAPNMLVGKLERCPFCGKIAVVAARPLEELRAAEAAELSGADGEPERPAISEQEKLRKDLEDSRYMDS